MNGAAALGAEYAPRAVSVRLRLVAVLGCTVLAYAFSLHSLLGGWRYDTPLADLALVPLLAALLLFASTGRYPHIAWLKLGSADVPVAALCMVAAFGVVAAGPVMWSKYFWASRLDLLTLPLFLIGALVLLFGLRSIIPFGFAVGFLLLAWPLPYLMLLEQTLGFFTGATAWAVHLLAVPTGLAAQAPGADGGVFVLEHGGETFSVAVASACSGVNTLVGFVVVAVFGAYFVRGSFPKRVLWLAAGALLVWCFNVLRVLAILGVGDLFGEQAAFKVLHPVSGLIALNLAALVLVFAMPLFGLRVRRDPADVDSPLATTAEPEERATPPRVVRRLGVLVAVTIVFAAASGPLRAAAMGYSNDGRPAVTPYVTSPVAAPGWTVRRLERIGFATPYYGQHSVWVRYRLRPSAAAPHPFTVWLDAVMSPDLGALNAYTLAHCYSFHEFRVDLERKLDLGDGVVGQAFVYTTNDAHWHAVSWQWPVLRQSGKVEHERIVLLASSPVRGTTADVPSSGGVWNTILSLLNLRARNDDDNPLLTRAMQGVAAAMVRQRVEAQT
jgi:exosortase/archaeosortase family protein